MAGQPYFTDYNPIPYLPRPLIGWEYLRRHPDYRRAWAKADQDRPRRTEIDDGTVLVKASRAAPAAESWGLRGFFRSPQRRNDRVRVLARGRFRARSVGSGPRGRRKCPSYERIGLSSSSLMACFICAATRSRYSFNCLT